MHAGLKNIIEFIKKADQLNSDKKMALLDTVKSVENELEITASSNKPVSGETIQLLERCAYVFDLTHTRFLDL